MTINLISISDFNAYVNSDKRCGTLGLSHESVSRKSKREAQLARITLWRERCRSLAKPQNKGRTGEKLNEESKCWMQQAALDYIGLYKVMLKSTAHQHTSISIPASAAIKSLTSLLLEKKVCQSQCFLDFYTSLPIFLHITIITVTRSIMQLCGFDRIHACICPAHVTCLNGKVQKHLRHGRLLA